MDLVKEYGIFSIPRKDWKSRWAEVQETDYDYDGDYLIRLITHKLVLMTKHLEDNLETTCVNDKKTIQQILSEVSELTQLGKRILTFNYGEEADKIWQSNGHSDWLLAEDGGEDFNKWQQLSEQQSNDRQKDIELFFNGLGKNINSWWF